MSLPIGTVVTFAPRTKGFWCPQTREIVKSARTEKYRMSVFNTGEPPGKIPQARPKHTRRKNREKR